MIFYVYTIKQSQQQCLKNKNKKHSLVASRFGQSFFGKSQVAQNKKQTVSFLDYAEDAKSA